MPTPTTNCYCGFSELDVLELIADQNAASFDRMQQILAAIVAGSPAGGSAVGGFSSLPDIINAVPGTAVQGTAFATVRGILVVAWPENTGYVYVGDSSVTNSSGSERGIILSQAGMPSTILPVDNANKIFVNADNAGDRVGLVAFT